MEEIVRGTLRWLRRVDHVIEQASGRPVERIDRRVISTLRVGAYQLLFLDRVPAHAVVDEAVKEIRRKRGPRPAGFVNAVLRRIAERSELSDWPIEEDDPVRRLAIESSHPDLLVRRWVDRFGMEAAQALVETNNRPKATALLASRDRGGRETLLENLAAEGVVCEPSNLSPLGVLVREGRVFETEAFARGDFYAQDEAGQVAALIPPPLPGESVLDLAAAPGGKSFAMMAWEPAARLVAADRSLARLGRLRRNRNRLERNFPLLVADAGRPPLAGGFDRVVLDFPCTGTGTLRKNPELKWRISEAEISRLSDRALDLLQAASKCVKVGGLLIGISCSVEAEEGNELLNRFLARMPEFAPLPLEDRLSEELLDGVSFPGFWRLLPAGEHDGYSVMVLTRQE